MLTSSRNSRQHKINTHSEILMSHSASTPIPETIAAAPRSGMKTWQRVLFFLVAWLIVSMPFIFWRGTWFGRPLSDRELAEYLHDESKPRHIQHGLVQVGERIARARAAGIAASQVAAPWYPELLRLASHPVEEIRNTDAWIMGQDASRPEFHAALLKMLNDGSSNVRSNAALSLVSFGDASGHAQIVAMLQPQTVVAPLAGRVTATAKAGEPIKTGTVLAHIVASAGQEADVRA